MASRRGRPFLKDTDEAEDVERGPYSPFMPPEETREAMFSSNVQHITNICILKSLVAQREHADILYCLYFAVFERGNETFPFRMHIIGLRVCAS